MRTTAGTVGTTEAVGMDEMVEGFESSMEDA